MAIELDIKINKKIAVKNLKNRIISIIGDYITANVKNDLIITKNKDIIYLNKNISKNKSNEIIIEYKSQAKVSVMAYYAGDPNYLGEEGDEWVVVNINYLRTSSSFLLAVFVSLALADISKTSIIDDSLIFKKSRELSKEQVFEILNDIVSRNSFEEFANELCSKTILNLSVARH